MRFAGKLQIWNGDRGFGFIRPLDGGQDVFVHVSSLPGGAPTAPEEVLTFEVAQDREGRKKAVNVRLQAREAAGLAADRAREAQRGRRSAGESGRGPSRVRGPGIIGTVLAFVLVAALGWNVWRHLDVRTVERPASTAAPAATASTPPEASFRCDGRTQCGQMRSCEEAKFFLRNCPGTQMDGDHDGIPCESQWCSGP